MIVQSKVLTYINLPSDHYGNDQAPNLADLVLISQTYEPHQVPHHWKGVILDQILII